MGKRSASKRAAKSTSRSAGRSNLDNHTKALERHAQALDRHTEALLSFASPATARELVYLVMFELLPSTKINDETKLATLGYDNPAKDVIRGKINSHNWHGVKLAMGALDTCVKIADVTKVVDTAKKF